MDWKTGSSSEAVMTASARQYVVMTPTSNCYLDYYQNTGVTYSVEPPAIGGNLPLSTVYAFEPIPASLPAQYDSYILGAQGNQWCEYVPSLENVEFKSYPRMCAIAEVAWTPAALKNYTNFTQRLVTHEQRLTQMGANYNSSSSKKIGTWAAAQITTGGGTVSWDITSSVSAAGEVDVSFAYTSGANALSISWLALQVNGVEIDRDTHSGSAGSSPSDPIYILHLPALVPGATYTIQAWVAGVGGTASSGSVYLPNWD
jgi:hexosaminidase